MSKKDKTVKTNAIRLIEQEQLDYELIQYAIDDDLIDGVSVAQKTKQQVETVFKTLVTQGADRVIYIFILPVAEELDLKKAAKAANVKKIELLPLDQLTKVTGYIRGGCSPVGMKKLYPTFIDESAKKRDHIIVSAGKPGLQMKVKSNELQRMIAAEVVELTIS